MISFEDVIGCWATNQSRWDKLKEAYMNNRIIPFIGAGMSIPVYPDWGQALKDALNGTKEEKEKLEDYLSKNQYENAADYVRRVKGNGFFESLDTVFNVNKIKNGLNKKIIPAASLLPDIFDRGPVLTTNFDKVLEHYYAGEKSFEEIYLLSNIKKNNSIITQLIRVGSRVLLKIHGDLADHDSLVFTKRQYKDVYEYDGFVEAMKRLAESCVFLYLGCSCKGGDRYSKVFKNVMDEHKQNYAFLSLPPRTRGLKKQEYNDSVKIREKELRKWGVYPIWYPSQKHEAVKVLLENLAQKSGVSDNKKNISLSSMIEMFIDETNLTTESDISFFYDESKVTRIINLANKIRANINSKNKFSDKLKDLVNERVETYIDIKETCLCLRDCGDYLKQHKLNEEVVSNLHFLYFLVRYAEKNGRKVNIDDYIGDVSKTVDLIVDVLGTPNGTEDFINSLSFGPDRLLVKMQKDKKKILEILQKYIMVEE